MAHPPPYPDTDDDSGEGSERGPAAGTSRWASVLGIVFLVILLAFFVFLHLTGVLGPGGH